ncbi:MAG: hypothetical protein LBH11_00840, partial [Propionibacteriaceae bacterium]|nr:hypothetical protein [Propionibacteriaceae bacterium]
GDPLTDLQEYLIDANARRRYEPSEATLAMELKPLLGNAVGQTVAGTDGTDADPLAVTQTGPAVDPLPDSSPGDTVGAETE